MFRKIVLITWTLQLFFKETKFSLVIDSLSQKGIVVSDYCPKMKYCEEGTHVMCMYYSPTRMMGPQCIDPKNVSMTSELAIKLLEVSNAIRGKMAMGLEKGKGGVQLPRAYGMFKLQWDNELATFAQVLANQCVLRHDMCRATKTFPNPGQTAGLVRFSNPDWFPVSKGGHFIKPGLTPSKITYAVTQALKSWYSQKGSVTPAMIIDYPDWTLNPNKQNGRLYLEMLHGPATHMGCGISAYVEYAYYDNKAPLNYNSIQVICNYSSRPKKHKTVYDLEPDLQTSKCGCPVNAVEDENCLCTYLEEEATPKEEMNCDGVNCEQPVILLPIFTVEDAPPSKLISRQGPIHNGASKLKGNHVEQQHRPNLPTVSAEFIDDDFPFNISKNEITRPITHVLNGIVDRNQVNNIKHHQGGNRKILEKMTPSHKQLSNSGLNHNQPKKTSIFSRSVLFGTPKTNVPLKLTLKDIKKDVVPRKDFSKAKNLANNYMESIKNFSVQYRPHLPEPKDKISRKFFSSTEALNNVEENTIFYNYNNETIHPKQTDIDHDEDQDTKLMSLLDKLEKEVQHIELSGNKKELFDAKIRKIYDSVVGKSSRLPLPKKKHFIVLESENPGNVDIDKLLDSENEYNHNHDHDTTSKKEIVGEHKESKKMYDVDIGKTIDDIVNLNQNFDHGNHLDEDDGIKSRRMRIKARINTGYNKDEPDFEFRLRETPNKNSQSDKLQSLYRDTDKDYKSYRFSDHRKFYKNQDQSYEDYKMNRFSIDDLRKGKRSKHSRDYYKTRDGNSIENLNKNHYRRHQIRNEERNVDDDVLSPERRKYYQERLENLERKLQNTRIHKYTNEDDHHRRPLRLQSSDDEAPRRPSKNHLEHFDMRERSRFIHGY